MCVYLCMCEYKCVYVCDMCGRSGRSRDRCSRLVGSRCHTCGRLGFGGEAFQLIFIRFEEFACVYVCICVYMRICQYFQDLHFHAFYEFLLVAEGPWIQYTDIPKARRINPSMH